MKSKKDNSCDVDLTRRALQKNPIANKLVVAEGGRHALNDLFGSDLSESGCKNELPALVLLDLGLPRMDGLRTLRRIRADEHTCHLPVIVLAASSRE